jgi:hypothetical protein
MPDMAASWHRDGVGATRAGVTRSYVFLGNLVLALGLIGYPLSGALSQILNLSSGDGNYAYRVFTIGLALILTIWTIARGTFRFDPLVGLFLTVYALRLWADMNYSTFLLPDIEQHFQFFLATVLMPTIAMAGGRNWFNERTCLRLVAAIGGIAALLIVYVLMTMSNSILAASRGGRAGFEVLNPISIGYHGLYIATASVMLMVRYRTVATMILCIPITLLGGYMLAISGSRGPFVALFAAMLLTGLAGRHTRMTYVVAGLAVAGLLSYFGAPEVISSRFQDAGQDSSSLVRLDAMQLSIDAAVANPILGYAYIEPATGVYPHNLLVESAMALGLVGFAMMLWMQISLVWNAWKAARYGEWLMPFLAAAMLANAWISGSLWGSGLFFMLACLVRERQPPSINYRPKTQHGEGA